MRQGLPCDVSINASEWRKLCNRNLAVWGPDAILREMDRFDTSRKKVSFFNAFAGLCAGAISAGAHGNEDFVGQVVTVAGKVLIRAESSQTMQLTFVKPGDKLKKGSILNTGSNGSVKLLMTDKTIIDLGPSSLFKVNEYQLNNTADRKVDVSVDYGQVRASVNQKVNPEKGKFTIRTKAATMGVRGTEFVVNAGLPPGTGPAAKPQTSITVMEGTVEVAGGGGGGSPVRVSQGMQLQQTTGGAPQVAQLNVQQMAQVRTEALQKDMTFLQAVVIEPSTGQNNGDRPSQEKVANKESGSSDGTSGEGGENVQGPAPASAPAEAPGNLTMAAVVENVSVSTAAVKPVQVTDLKLPGVMTGPMTPPQGVQIIQGLPRNIQVIFNPN